MLKLQKYRGAAHAMASVVKDRQRRNAVIRQAHLAHIYSLSEIGRAVQLHYATVSRIVTKRIGEGTKRFPRAT